MYKFTRYMVAVDGFNSGQCAVLDMNSISGEVPSGVVPRWGTNPTIVIMFYGNFSQMSTTMTMTAFDSGDDLLANTVHGEDYGTARLDLNVKDFLGVQIMTHVRAKHISKSSVQNFQIFFEQERINLKDCESDPDRIPITKCILSFLERGNSTDCSAHPSELAQKCTVRGYGERMEIQEEHHSLGYEHVAHSTGCLLPCRRRIATIKTLFHSRVPDWHALHISFRFPRKMRYLQVARCMFYRVKNKKSFPFVHRRITEKYAYSFDSILSDAGGMSGLFLGLSFWSLADMAIDAIKWAKGTLNRGIRRRTDQR